ncbi:MAG: MBL fold metallo-hydrolase [Pseudomonadota bacterium]
MIFRQLFDPQSATYTYLLADSATLEAVLIDPVFEQARRDAALAAELGVKLVWTLETHVHADHVTGAWLLRRRLGSRIALGAKTGAEGADRLLAHGERIEFGRRYLVALETPGHTAGCLSYVLDNETMVFTGDTLLIRGCGRTDFQSGDARRLYRSVRDRLFALPGTCLVYPAHDYRGLTCSSIAEEKRFNPRLGEAVAEDDFVGYMTHLGLPHPKQMEVAVPANLRCGRPEKQAAFDDEPDWAPLVFTFAGIWEVHPEWLEENLDRVQVVDVREPSEFNGPLGHIPGAKLIPLGTLAQRAKELVGAKPVVTVCRSGARSAQATVLLRQHGITRAANLAGGMLRWRALGYRAEGARD